MQTSGATDFAEPLTVVFSWSVKHGEEQSFKTMMHAVHLAARRYPGHMGVTTLQSPAGRSNFYTILRFDTYNHMHAWLSSPERDEVMKPLYNIASLDKGTQANGLETWFQLPGQSVTPPPRWKMVLATFIAIYPLSFLFNQFVITHIESWPTVFRSIVFSLLAPAILTYLLMPFLTQKVLRRWLYAEQS